MQTQLPLYFDRLIKAWEDGRAGRLVHLGHWDFPPEPGETDPESDTFKQAQQRLDDIMVELAVVGSNQSVLDVGCGLGGLLEGIDQQFEDMQLVGINIDPRQLDICQRLRSRSGNSFRWQEADACALPFPDQSFDRVFCVEAMFHFSSRRTFIEEVCRVLKPGGRFAFSDIRLKESSSISMTPRFLIEAVLNDGYGPWPDPWTENGSCDSICRSAGLLDVRVMDATINTLPMYDYIIPARFSERHDPGDPAARSVMVLRWLHQNGGLFYEYIGGVNGS